MPVPGDAPNRSQRTPQGGGLREVVQREIRRFIRPDYTLLAPVFNHATPKNIRFGSPYDWFEILIFETAFGLKLTEPRSKSNFKLV